MRITLAVALILILVLGVALGVVGLRSLNGSAISPGADQTDTSADARASLQQLEVAPPGSMSGYSRDRFRHWSKASNFGWDPPQASCDAREAALIRDGEDVEVGSGCKVTSGTWYDPYTDRTYSDPQDLDIDHVVPLANAWRSGAPS
jgi:hypothetical protein